MAKRRIAPQRRSISVSSDHPNHLLAALPAEDFARVQRTLDTVRVKVKQILHKPDEPVDHVYFPGNGFCSVLTVLQTAA